jgi:hypothetical protein
MGALSLAANHAESGLHFTPDLASTALHGPGGRHPSLQCLVSISPHSGVRSPVIYQFPYSGVRSSGGSRYDRYTNW